MEAILSSQAVDLDVLSPSISYGLSPTGSWCLAKREATTFALASAYSPGGVKKIDVSFGSTTEWLVPDSVVFSAEFQNLDATNAAFPCTPDANCLFESIEVRMSGQLIERITESARCNELFTRLTMSPQKKVNLAQMGFGTKIPTAQPDWSAAQNHEAGTIPASASKRIHWKCNLSGILSQHKWIPLYALSQNGLQVSFFCAPVDEALISSDGVTNYSQSYQLKDVKATCQMCTISDELMESFQGQLLNGSALRIPYKKLESFYSYVPTSVTAGKFDIPMSRTYTRLCQIFASFVQEPSATSKLKLCNNFYTHTPSSETLAYNFQIGTKKLLDNDSVGFSESWHRTLQGLGISNSLSHATGITFADYATNSYAIIADMEKIPHLASTGENVSNTSQITLRVSGFGTTANDLPSRCHLVAVADSILEIRDTTVEVFD